MIVKADPGSPFIDVVREFAAPPARVFRAWTDPALVARWLVPHGVEMTVLEFDARSGGSYRYVHREDSGAEHRFRGVFHTVVPDERIIQTFEYEGWPDVVSVESVTYEDLGGRTRVRRHTAFPSVAARDTALASGMERGIVESMAKLESLLGGGSVLVDISMSLDGFVAAPGVDLSHGLGVGGEAVHEWAISRLTPRDEEILQGTVDRTGAVIMGRRTFDIVDAPGGWSSEMGYGGARGQDSAPPVFVVTHSVPSEVRLASRFTFVTDGLAAALARAREAAGAKDVVIMGGGSVASGFLSAGLVDLLSIHVAPVVFGGGTPLFPPDLSLRLSLLSSESTDAATHLTYRVINDG
ncbi:SRPBCC domain-containing protein [Actinomadura sp. DC4]|uniref:SRPBCC domain-containing protein n=1 Tax=Actinomadura sp. DC4 TaxID=3055069 RepID=UPI0025B0E2AA|nr:SRPBCC domain-containing protein [Actinomadura sp. DC4]MDN3352917.1 SRPBCC domain-containing protein [Actinomadura sp. DC4]